MSEKVAEARVDLAICYWRESALDEARVTLRLALDGLGETESEQKLRALYNSAIVEKVATRDQEAFRIYREIAPKFETCGNHSLKAKFHNFSATLLRGLAATENREEYIDKALIEYAAASFHFEQAGHDRFRAHVENNTAYLFADIGRLSEAREHVNKARRLFSKVGDHGGTAYADDTLAQIYLLEGNSRDAEKVARRAVHALGRGGEQSYLAEALTTQGKALARLNQIHSARTSLDQALEIAQVAGNPDRGGIAAITAIEELSEYLSTDALKGYYSTAERLLSNSQNLTIKTRLGECARRVLTSSLANTSTTSNSSPTEEPASIPPDFSLDAEVLRYEGSLIRKALEESGGSVTRAARLLGVTHQGLAFILNGRHSDLQSIRTPVKRRRRSIIRHH
jgi:tetratricopeptide (TPR) repeat protein